MLSLAETRIPRSYTWWSWDSPWETGMKDALGKAQVQVAQSCLTLCDPMDYIVHGILQARILEWVAIPFSGTESSRPRD